VVQRQFWQLIATGISTAEAAIAVGVSVPVGMRWFRHAGGMPPISLAEPSGRYLSFEEREEIALLKAQGKGVRGIAREIGRDPGTVSRELRRNARPGAASRSTGLWWRSGSRSRPRSARRPRSWSRTIGCVSMSGAEQAPPGGPAMVDGVEPGTDRATVEGRVPR
jgi:DNA-binding CsgD family transcriptional regulator